MPPRGIMLVILLSTGGTPWANAPYKCNMKFCCPTVILCGWCTCYKRDVEDAIPYTYILRIPTSEFRPCSGYAVKLHLLGGVDFKKSENILKSCGCSLAKSKSCVFESSVLNVAVAGIVELMEESCKVNCVSCKL